MRKAFIGVAACAAALATALLSPAAALAADGTDMYRLYNPNSGEHFYTASAGERSNLKAAGWRSEGTGWEAPTSGEAVYRVYNPNGGDHHYTTSAGERNALVKLGWRDEGVGWRSGGSVAVYRLYNPKAATGAHHYTTSAGERDLLVKAGWKSEGVGWYATAVGKSEPAEKVYKVRFDLNALWGSETELFCTNLYSHQGTFVYNGFTIATQYGDLKNLNPQGFETEDVYDMRIKTFLVKVPGTNVKLRYREQNSGTCYMDGISGPLSEIVDGVESGSLSVTELATHLQAYGGAFDNNGAIGSGSAIKKQGLCVVEDYGNPTSILFADSSRTYSSFMDARRMIFYMGTSNLLNGNMNVSINPTGWYNG